MLTVKLTQNTDKEAAKQTSGKYETGSYSKPKSVVKENKSKARKQQHMQAYQATEITHNKKQR